MAVSNATDDIASWSETTDPDPTGINSDPYDPAVGNQAPWAEGASGPQSDFYAGWHWDDSMGRYMKNPQAASVETPTTPTAPTGSGTGNDQYGNPLPSNNVATPPPAAPPPPVAPPAVPSGGTTSPSPTPPSVSPATAPEDAAFRKSIRDALLKAMGQGPVSADDEDIAPAITANRVASERSLAQERDQIAERMNAQGLSSSGSLDAQMQAARERTGNAQAQFSGNAVMNQAVARRQQLTSLLQIGGGIMSGDDTRGLQAKIADLDAFLRQQSITNQNNQFNDQLGLTAAQFKAFMDQYIAGMGARG